MFAAVAGLIMGFNPLPLQRSGRTRYTRSLASHLRFQPTPAPKERENGGADYTYQHIDKFQPTPAPKERENNWAAHKSIVTEVSTHSRSKGAGELHPVDAGGG